MIGIIDYGLGNIGSVVAAIKRVGKEPIVSSDPLLLHECSHLILPGVGAFPDGMNNLRKKNLVGIIKELVLEHKTPILGICLGFQLLAEGSTEFGYTNGLGLISGNVIKIDDQVGKLRIPHVGWNDFLITREQQLFSGLSKSPLFYYCHSYCLRCDEQEDIAGTTEYGQTITAAISRENIYGVQFHPEKSQADGLTLLKNFTSI